MTRTSLLASAVIVGAFSLVAGAALAASGGGGGGGGGSSGSSSGATTPHCKTGYVWNAKKYKCEKATSSTLDDKTLYAQGRELALAGRYEEALTALDAVKTPDSMTFTMIGYSQRKQGNYDVGVSYYAKALALDPNNINTHEYLGEAYAEKGKLDLAKAELVKVEAVCGQTCEQYQDLSKAIAGKPDQS